MRHLIDPLDFTVEETQELLALANRIAANPAAYQSVCAHKKLATCFMSLRHAPAFPLSRQC